jgi:hypothetical protein
MTPHAYITACKNVINTANKLYGAICTERMQFKTDCVSVVDGRVGDAFTELRQALNALRVADHQLDLETNPCAHNSTANATNPAPAQAITACKKNITSALPKPPGI